MTQSYGHSGVIEASECIDRADSINTTPSLATEHGLGNFYAEDPDMHQDSGTLDKKFTGPDSPLSPIGADSLDPPRPFPPTGMSLGHEKVKAVAQPL